MSGIMRNTDFDTTKLLQRELTDHLAVATATHQAIAAPFNDLVRICVGALKAGNKLMLFGNGGSAGDAQHIATELTVRYRKDRPALAALALTTDTSALTAIGNDYTFDDLFSRQIEALGKSGDVAIGITTSGNSGNVLKALTTAKRMGCLVAGLAGHEGGKLVGLVDPLLIVPSKTTARIQEMHILIGHTLCNAIEIEMGYSET